MVQYSVRKGAVSGTPVQAALGAAADALREAPPQTRFRPESQGFATAPAPALPPLARSSAPTAPTPSRLPGRASAPALRTPRAPARPVAPPAPGTAWPAAPGRSRTAPPPA